MTSRKAQNLLIAILGGSIASVGIVMVCFLIAAIVGADSWQDADIEPIDRTGCYEGQRHDPDSVVDRCSGKLD